VIIKDFNIISDINFYFIIAEYFSVVAINISDGDFYIIIINNITNVNISYFYILY
jgi:hypothetical protein